VLPYCATAPMPEGLDELLLAGFLARRRIELVACVTVDLEVPAAELAARRAKLKPRAPTTDSGWLSIYERTVSPLSQGASLLGKN